MKKRSKMTPNVYIERDNYYELVIFSSEERGCKELVRSKISKDMLPVVGGYKWCLEKAGYIHNRTTKIHQIILGIKKRKDIDHINGDKLDNRTENLRHVTHQENLFNIKKERGIHFDKLRNKWKAEIGVNYKNILLGRFHTKEEAIAARKAGERKYHKIQS